MSEEWRAVVGNPLYEVSDAGQVRRVNGALLRQTVKRRYLTVCLYSGKRHRDKRYPPVHQLVLEAFLGSRPLGRECNHKDGDRFNNTVANLEWVTKSENIRHSFRLGLNSGLKGSRNGGARLTEEQVREIKSAPRRRGTQAELARRFGVGPNAISDIVNGRKWRHV